MATIDWYRALGGSQAHAFVEGPGWMRSACGAVRWSVTLVRALDRPWLCPECVQAIDARRPAPPAMSEPEAREAFGA